MVAGRARLLGRCTFYAVLPVAGVKGQPPGLLAPPSSFLTIFLPFFFLFFFWADDDAAASSSSWRRRPAAPTVSSVPPWILSWCHFPFLAAPLGIPALPNGQHRWFTALGSGGGWATAGRWDGNEAEPPRLPLSTPQQRSLTLGLFRKDKKKKTKRRSRWLYPPARLPAQAFCVTLHRRTNYQTNVKNKVRTTTKDARFHLTRITHQHPCNKLNYYRVIPLYSISRCITKTEAWGI